MNKEEAINILWMYDVNFEPHPAEEVMHAIDMAIEALRQPEIVQCKDCCYGEQDEAGRWFCRSLCCQIGNEDGSGYCADAERRTNN